MDKSTRELIEKMASKDDAVLGLSPRAWKGVGLAGAGVGAAYGAYRGAKGAIKKMEQKDESSEKKSSMKNIIDDIIKGAEQNSFGRPVSIQADTEWTHLDTAKTAGVLRALGEQGYSVKAASEYLGLPEKQIQDILVTVR